MGDKGYIYVLSNPSMKEDMLKIGMTRRDPKERAVELSRSTGVPTDFVVAYQVRVPDCRSAEKLVHERLSKYRTSKRKEFFSLPSRDAIHTVKEVAAEVREQHRSQVRWVALIQKGYDKVADSVQPSDHLASSRTGHSSEINGCLVFSPILPTIGVTILIFAMPDSYSDALCIAIALIWVFSTAGLMTIVTKRRKEEKNTGCEDLSSDDLDGRLRTLVKRGKKIQAIKELRRETGMSLRQAKDYVEQL